MRLDRSIIEGLQDIVSLLEDQLKPLVQSELSLLVDVLYHPELLFPSGTESRKKCESGGFIRRLIKHTEKLLEEKEEKLCVKVLKTLREMMAIDPEYGEKVGVQFCHAFQFSMIFAYSNSCLRKKNGEKVDKNEMVITFLS